MSIGWVAGRIWHDKDCDGKEDHGESGAGSVTVDLVDKAGNVVATTQTDGNGQYSFDAKAGQYQIRVSQPDGKVFTEENAAGTNIYNNSNVDASGVSNFFTLYPGCKLSQIDAGLKDAPKGSISGRLFCDDDCDGLEKPREAVVTKGPNLIVNGDFEDHKGSGDGGKYYGLSGNDVAGWSFVGSRRADLFEDAKSVFGNAQGDAIIELDKGAVLRQHIEIPEAGKYHLTFDVLENSSVSSGNNDFVVKINGKTVETVVANGKMTVTVELDLDAGPVDLDFVSKSGDRGDGAAINNVELRKEIVTQTPGDDSRAGVTVDLLDGAGEVVATTVTDEDGRYAFDGLDAGDYQVRFTTPEGKVFTQQNIGDDDSIDSDADASGLTGVISLGVGEHISDVDAGLKDQPPGSISGRVFCDENCDGLDSPPEPSTGKGPNLIVNGGFEINDLPGDAGELLNITELEGWDLGGAKRIDLYEDAQSEFGNEQGNAIIQLDKAVIISQVVIAEAGTYHLSFDLYENTTTTRNNNDVRVQINGESVALVFAEGVQTIELEVDLAAGPVEIEFNGQSGDTAVGPAIDNVALRQAIATDGEPEDGKEGVTVMLLDADGEPVPGSDGQPITTVTDADGNYHFDGVRPGDYRVKVVAPEGSGFTEQNVGDDDSIDSDVDADGVSGVITVPAATHIGDIDAGLKPVEVVEVCHTDIVDFEFGQAGDIVSEIVLVNTGVTATVQGDASADPNGPDNDAMLFDATNPTGGDQDLFAPGQGNVLILTEDDDATDPDDAAAGGSATLTFSEAVTVDSMVFIDANEGTSVTGIDANGAEIGTVVVASLEDGELAKVELAFDDVVELQIAFTGSGAIDDIVVHRCVEEETLL
ncbi:MAG: SdrD B-like domain-containing protein [Pseudomonadota bacterium]